MSENPEVTEKKVTSTESSDFLSCLQGSVSLQSSCNKENPCESVQSKQEYVNVESEELVCDSELKMFEILGSSSDAKNSASQNTSKFPSPPTSNLSSAIKIIQNAQSACK